MNRDETEKAIEVMQAWVDGADIEMRSVMLGLRWVPKPASDQCVWDWDGHEYRVKPRPREWWILKNPSGTCILDYKPVNPGYIHVREVIEP